MKENRLREILDKEGIQQSDLARESGISTGTINAKCTTRKNGKIVNTRNAVKVRLVDTINKMKGTKYKVSDIFP